MDGIELNPLAAPASAFLDATDPTQQSDRLQRLAEQAAKDGSVDEENLQQAARDFEALFLNFLLKSMRNTVPDNKLFNSKGPTKFYQQLHDQELAKSVASGPQGLGIDRMIINQVSRAQTASEDQKSPAVAEPGLAGERLLPSHIRRGMRSYQAQGADGRRIGQMVTLRRRVGQLGTSAADTLQRYQRDLAAASEQTGVDPALLFSVLLAESGGDPDAVSPKGAVGLMQLMPGTARELGVERPEDPQANIAGGARYLAQMLARFDSRTDLALAAYNAGPGAVTAAGEQIPAFSETRRYVARVLDTYRRLSGDDGTKIAK